MTETPTLCPACASEYNYEQGALLVCSMCAHEWNLDATVTGSAEDGVGDGAETNVVVDAFGTPLADGDTVTIIKDLKVKGSQSSIKVGTKVRGIRLINGVGDHDIDCKVDGFGQMQLKSSVVKKA
ncbi:MAG: zinc ribbon domain-containing protein YjdM [Microbacteriaceae bacterium]